MADAERITAVLALHQPTTEEAESWPWTNDRHDIMWPDCDPDACEGHLHTLEVCNECGTSLDFGQMVYRAWPCPTVRALTGDDDG